MRDVQFAQNIDARGGLSVPLLTLFVTIFGIMFPTAAFAEDTIDVVPDTLTHHLSWDGLTYSTNETSIFGDRIIVPGDAITRHIVVTNNSSKRADLGMKVVNATNQSGANSDVWDYVTLSWDAGETGQTTLGEAFEANVIDNVTLGPNETRTLVLTLGFPITRDGNASVAGTSTSDFDMEFSLFESTSTAPTPSPTPSPSHSPTVTPTPDSIQTGGALPNLIFAGGLFFLIGSLGLVIMTRRVREHH